MKKKRKSWSERDIKQVFSGVCESTTLAVAQDVARDMGRYYANAIPSRKRYLRTWLAAGLKIYDQIPKRNRNKDKSVHLRPARAHQLIAIPRSGRIRSGHNYNNSAGMLTGYYLTKANAWKLSTQIQSKTAGWAASRWVAAARMIATQLRGLKSSAGIQRTKVDGVNVSRFQGRAQLAWKHSRNTKGVRVNKVGTGAKASVEVRITGKYFRSAYRALDAGAQQRIHKWQLQSLAAHAKAREKAVKNNLRALGKISKVT